MTVLAAAITRLDGVVIAADSEISWDYTKSHEGSGKLWVDRERKFAFASCGDVRAAQVIQHWTDWPEFRDYHQNDIERFVIREVVPAIREALNDHGSLSVSKSVETFGAGLIMAWGNNLVAIDEDFSVLIPTSGRWAMGSGLSEAFGSLGEDGPWTKNDVIKAARVSTKTAAGVGGNIWYVSTRSLEVRLG